MTTAVEAKKDLKEEMVPLMGAWAERITFAELERNKKTIEVMRRGVGLYSLLRSGTIRQWHVDAAQRWARDFETGIMGAADPERRSTGQGTLEDMMLARSAAVARCEGVRRTLGRYASDLLVLLVLDGLSVAKIAEMYGKNRQSMTGAVELLLEQLGDYYEANQIH
ncbi:hypothetical protein AD942_11015 [Gluconobacter japonicus]|uniref:hypothetical protein n=1 Tax=Gluconobacter japonicus TaxID=376620 RepID=UPI0007843C23|nr:hypothetical protein [Gluconobacter japonicus]KXV23871.1 hypothetical protein AD936_20970 [Gluconobacter japonicus]KXV39433.1 hypothetical protein AD942_11015 [Gluconobacter japonicus]